MKTLKTILTVFIGITLFASCSKDDDNQKGEEELEVYGDHSFTYTVNGPGLTNQTFSKVIPNNDAGAYFTVMPGTNYKGTSFTLAEGNLSMIGVLIRKNDQMAPFGPNNGNPIENSELYLLFGHENDFYTMKSVSGTCTTIRYEERSFGTNESGTVSFKITFSGIFSGGVTGTNNPDEYEVNGEVDVKFLND